MKRFLNLIGHFATNLLVVFTNLIFKKVVFENQLSIKGDIFAFLEITNYHKSTKSNKMCYVKKKRGFEIDVEWGGLVVCILDLQ
jgi:hypothetical protein